MYKFLTRAKVRTSVNPAWAISCLSRSQSVFSLNCKTKVGLMTVFHQPYLSWDNIVYCETSSNKNGGTTQTGKQIWFLKIEKTYNIHYWQWKNERNLFLWPYKWGVDIRVIRVGMSECDRLSYKRRFLVSKLIGLSLGQKRWLWYRGDCINEVTVRWGSTVTTEEIRQGVTNVLVYH